MHGLLCVWISGHFFYVALPPAVQSSELQREVENSPSFTNSIMRSLAYVLLIFLMT